MGLGVEAVGRDPVSRKWITDIASIAIPASRQRIVNNSKRPIRIREVGKIPCEVGRIRKSAECRDILAKTGSLVGEEEKALVPAIVARYPNGTSDGGAELVIVEGTLCPGRPDF